MIFVSNRTNDTLNETCCFGRFAKVAVDCINFSSTAFNRIESTYLMSGDEKVVTTGRFSR